MLRNLLFDRSSVLVGEAHATGWFRESAAFLHEKICIIMSIHFTYVIGWF